MGLGEKMITMRSTIALMSMLSVFGCSVDPKISADLKTSFDRAFKVDGHSPHKADFHAAKNQSLWRVLKQLRPQKFTLRIDVKIPGQSMMHLMDRVTLEIDKRHNWNLNHSTTYIDETQRKLTHGRRCQQVSNQLYLAGQYGPWTQIKKSKDVGRRCLETSADQFNQIFQQLRDSIRFEPGNVSEQTNHKTYRLKSSQMGLDAPIELPSSALLSKYQDSKAGSRRPFIVTQYIRQINHGYSDRRHGQKHISSADVRLELSVKRPVLSAYFRLK